jgi:hypothetical protein
VNKRKVQRGMQKYRTNRSGGGDYAYNERTATRLLNHPTYARTLSFCLISLVLNRRLFLIFHNYNH